MSSESKKRLEIILAIGILIALVILILLFLRSKPGLQIVEEPEVSQRELVQEMEETTVSATNEEAPSGVIARNFVERFGSFSSEVDFVNVEDVLPLVTPGLAARLKTLTQDTNSDLAYYGVSTKFIGFVDSEELEVTANYTITTQREESFDSPENTSVRYQDINVDLVKDGDIWLVNDYQWQ
jgi:hypothetical protein